MQGNRSISEKRNEYPDEQDMFAFTQHLKNEMEVILLGLSMLEIYSKDLYLEKMAPIEDIRLALYAVQISFEDTHLVKAESLLIPKLLNSQVWKELPNGKQNKITEELNEIRKSRNQLLDLRFRVDQYGINKTKINSLTFYLAEYVRRITWHLEYQIANTLALADEILTPSEQNEMLHRALSTSTSPRVEFGYKSRIILNRLRFSRGLPAA